MAKVVRFSSMLFTAFFVSGVALESEIVSRIVNQGPDNSAVVAGQPITLYCTSNETITFTWYFTKDGDIDQITIVNDGILNSQYAGVYDIETSPGICNLIVLNATRNQAGVYRCKETTGFASQETASLVVLDSEPVCSMNTTLPDVLEDEVVLMTCSVTYTANFSPLQMNWTDPSGTLLTSITNSSTPGYIESSIMVTAMPPKVGEHKCLTFFTAPNNPPTTAKNAPAYTHTYTSAELGVTACPADTKIIKPSGDIFLGDQLRCQVSGDDPDATITWSLKETGTITSGPTVTLKRAGINTYNCTARITVQGLTCTMSASYVAFVTASSCLQILQNDPKAASDRYTITTISGKPISVYCEMGLNTGGFTFLSPKSLLDLSNDDVQAMQTDKQRVLLRFRKCDNTQPYAVLRQLPEHRPYLFFGFLPRTYYMQQTNIGLMVNNVVITSTKPESEGYNYMALYPGFQSTSWYDVTTSSSYYSCDTLFYSTLRTPSGLVIPNEFFMFYEAEMTSICYANTNSQILTNACILTAAIGFR